MVPCVPCRGERVPRQLQETPGASSGIPLPGQLSLSPPLGMIFTIKDLVLSLVLHPVCRCLQVLFAVAAVSRLKACPSGQEIRGLPPPWAQAQPEKGIHEPDGSTVPRCLLGGMGNCK